MEKNELKETCVGSKELFSGVVAHLFIDDIVLPNGKRSTREYLKHNGAVAVLPLDADGNVYLVDQYRYPFSRVLTEIPAGKLDSPEEDHFEAAMRELREETGLTSACVTPLGEYIGSPALLGETIYIYLARELSQGDQDLDPDEFLNVKKIPLDELVERIMAGEIKDGKTVFAALKVKLLKDEKKI